jgi:hypothetical protein
MWTHYSSFSFLAAGLYSKKSWMNNWLPILASFSILNHSKYHESYKGKRVIQWIDRIIAHKIATRTFFEAWLMRNKSSPWLYSYYGCLLYTIMVYYGILRRKPRLNWHASMHLVSSIGCLCLYRHKRLYRLKSSYQ